MNNDIPRRRNIDSLKNEARRWFNALGNNDVAIARAANDRLAKILRVRPPAPTLRDVQHALARENGFDGWSALKLALAPNQQTTVHTIALYEERTSALLEAYRTGTAEALERHYAFTWHRRAWSTLRTYVQLDLGTSIAQDGDGDITLDDAKFLVAREHGFESWFDLITFAAHTPGALPIAEGIVRVSAMRAELDHHTDSVTIVESRDWGTVLRALADHPGASLYAHGHMTDAMLERISHIPHVQSLNLSNSQGISVEGMQHIAKLSQLRTLDLSGTQASDAWLEVMHNLPHLQSVSLAMTAVTDASMAHFSDCNALAELNLMWTNTGNGAVHAMAGKEKLAHFKSGNLLTEAGLAMLHELPVFKTWRNGTPQFELLSNTVRPNQLALRGFFTDIGMRALRGLDGLFGLHLDDSQQPINAPALEPLTALPRLGALSVKATDDWMPFIARMPALQFLSVQDTTATDHGWVALSQSQCIEQIWGRRCHNLRARGFRALATMARLRALSVSCRNVDDVALELLPEFPALRELMPIDIPDTGYRHIAQCSNLESLQLMYCRDTTDAATEHIVTLEKLERYFNSYTTITDRTPQLLSQMDSLRSITFDACHGLTDAGVAQLARLPKLAELRVAGNGLTREVAKGFPARVAVHYSR